MVRIKGESKYKILGEIFLSLPGVLFIILGIGELSGGIISGVQHFVQLVPIIIFAIVCWIYPKKGGVLLVSIAIVLFILYFFTSGGTNVSIKLINDLIIFGPLIISGIFFIIEGK